jgi:hypothetical protein
MRGVAHIVHLLPDARQGFAAFSFSETCGSILAACLPILPTASSSRQLLLPGTTAIAVYRCYVARTLDGDHCAIDGAGLVPCRVPNEDESREVVRMWARLSTGRAKPWHKSPMCVVTPKGPLEWFETDNQPRE